jgi:hypothetical protein
MGCVAHIGEMRDVADILGEVVCVAHIEEMGCVTHMVYGMCSSHRRGDKCKCYTSGKT